MIREMQRRNGRLRRCKWTPISTTQRGNAAIVRIMAAISLSLSLSLSLPLLFFILLLNVVSGVVVVVLADETAAAGDGSARRCDV